MTTVTWTQDVNSNYEISSPEHLKQLMNKGTLYTDAGTFPTDYWAAGTNYIQTADIDLLGDSTDIKPIGIETDIFYGNYDGGEFSISNWSYLDPEFETGNNNESSVGLFGHCQEFTLKNIRLNGVWTLQGYRSNAGFLLGYGNDTSTTEIRGVFNIECDFSKGTFIENTPNVNGYAIGCVFGRLQCPIIEGVTLRGEIDLRNVFPGFFHFYVGGIVGFCEIYIKGSLIQNLATFPNGLSANGRQVGGIMGSYSSSYSFSHCLNAMTGDITGSQYVGGIVGFASIFGTQTTEYLVNAMYGDIVYNGTSTSSTFCAGGVIGYINTTIPIGNILNYMTGDIISISIVGGLVGYFRDNSGAELNDSLNAMNGNTKFPIIGGQRNSNLVVSRVQVNTNYGLTFDEADTYSTSTAPSGFLTNSTLVDLPYFDIDGTDEIGNTYNFDFVYANISGSSSYTDTHVVVTNGVNNLENRTPRLSIVPSTTSINAVIYEDPNETILGYNITIESSSGENAVFSGVTTLTHDITSLSSNTNYIVRLYTDSGSGYTLTSSLETSTLYPIVTWVQDSNGNYEVSSAAHLKQLMNNGTLYTDDGTTPTDMYASGISYIQTADIDLLGDSTDIKPIGDDASKFYGNYNGNGFEISNWSFVDPFFPYGSTSVDFVGLFGYNENNTIENIRLGGVWTIQGYDQYAAFLVSNQRNHGGGNGIRNIECDFSPGSFIESNKLSAHCAGVIAYLDNSKAIGITLRGSLDFIDTFPASYTGGVISRSFESDITLVQNLATFPSGIKSTNSSGGIIGFFDANPGSISKCMNAMTGDISSLNRSGGVIGYANYRSGSCSQLVNSMIGDIFTTGTSGRAGGVVGFFYLQDLASHLFNYMSGNITGTGDVGGLMGYYRELNSDGGISDCLNAMNGSVPHAIIGFREGTLGTISSVNKNTNFGLTFTETDTYSTGFPSVDVLYLTDFPDLPYFTLDGTYDGYSYDFDFVYANLGGNVSYSTTHLLVVEGQSLFQNGIVTPPLTVNPRAVNIRTVIGEVSDAIGYKISHLDPNDIETTFVKDVTTLEHNITGLVSDTDYVIRLYVDTGTGYVLTEELPTRTFGNVSSNYDVTDFIQGGVVKLNSFPKETLSEVNKVMNQLFNTGDKISVSVRGNPDLRTSFIKRGESLNINGLKGVMLPFEEGNTTGQVASIVLSDGATTIDIDYDNVVDSITVNSIEYYPGDSFILDGKKVTVIGS